MLICSEIQKPKRLKDILPSALPRKMTCFDEEYPTLYRFLELFNVSFLIERRGQMENNKQIRFKTEISSLFLNFIYKPSTKDTLQMQEAIINEFLIEILKLYNKCSVLHLKIIYLKLKIQILKYILIQMKQSNKFAKNYLDLKISEMIKETQTELRETETNFTSSYGMYTYLSKKTSISDVIILNLDIKKMFNKTIKKSKYLQNLKTKKDMSRFDYFSLDLYVAHRFHGYPPEFRLSLRNKKPDSRYEKTLREIQFIENLFQNLLIHNNSIFKQKENIKSLYSLIQDNLEILHGTKMKYNISNETFISCLNRLFSQIEYLLRSLEILLQKQEEVLKILVFQYFINDEIDILDQEEFNDIFKNLSSIFETDEE